MAAHLEHHHYGCPRVHAQQDDALQRAPDDELKLALPVACAARGRGGGGTCAAEVTWVPSSTRQTVHSAPREGGHTQCSALGGAGGGSSSCELLLRHRASCGRVLRTGPQLSSCALWIAPRLAHPVRCDPAAHPCATPSRSSRPIEAHARHQTARGGCASRVRLSPCIPERGLNTTSTTARSASSLRGGARRGPYTAASTHVFSCAHLADPSARCS